MRSRTVFAACVIAIILTLLPPFVLQRSAVAQAISDADRAEGVQLLIDGGAVVTEDKGANKVSLKLKPGLTESRIRTLIDTVFQAGLKYKASNGASPVYQAPSSMRGTADGIYVPQIENINYYDCYSANKHSFVILEPLTRINLCYAITADMQDQEKKTQLREKCAKEIIDQVTRQRLAFTGKPVTYPGDVKFGGTVSFCGPLWPKGKDGKAEILLLAHGSARIETVRTLAAQVQIIANLPFGMVSPGAKGALEAQKTKSNTMIAKVKVAGEAAWAKLGKTGNKVLFFASPVSPFEEPMVAKGTVSSCANVYWKGYGPRGKAKAKAGYEFEVFVDDQRCGWDGFGSDQNNPEVEGCPLWTGSNAAKLGCTCSKLLLPVGEHKVRVELYQHAWKRTGNLKIEGDGKIRKEEESHRGKAIAKGTISCSSDESLQQSYR
jgi:hypothetical protein